MTTHPNTLHVVREIDGFRVEGFAEYVDDGFGDAQWACRVRRGTDGQWTAPEYNPDAYESLLALVDLELDEARRDAGRTRMPGQPQHWWDLPVAAACWNGDAHDSY